MKKIRLITLFSGYDSQKLAFNYLGVDVEHYRAVEFEKNAVDSLNNIHGTHFEPKDISTMKGADLGIVDKDNYKYIMTYSFPCTDISLAGRREGMEKGSGTRSSLLWEVERLLNETEELPDVLIMENVPLVVSAQGWDDWLLYLAKKGYSNYYKCLNAKDYGIPQNRNRCFMVSLLGDKKYEFPKPFKLKLRLRDFLEDEVDEKYYLSKKMVKYIVADNEKWSGNNNHSYINKTVASTINTGEGSRRCDASNYIAPDLEEDDIDLKAVQPKMLWTETQARMITEDGNVKRYINSEIVDEFKEGQCADISFPNGYNKAKRTHDECPAINTTTTQSSFVVKVPLKRGYDVEVKEENKDTTEIDIIGNYSKSEYNATPIVGKNGVAPTVRENHGQVTAVKEKDKTRIRKLTPKECFRLMGVLDEDYNKIKCSNTQKYKQAGNSIVTTCLMAIYSNLFDNIDYKTKIEEFLKKMITSC